MSVSVVIGFKDWGLERLLLSIRSLREALLLIEGEVIVSDYGSTTFAPGELKEIVEREGALYVRTDTDGTWSRSRAVNAGFRIASGQVLIATDADMLFTPESIKRIHDTVVLDPNQAVILQCRDLPEAFDHISISSNHPSWETLASVAQIRPRWGMGGMFAVHRETLAQVGGYDNRMHTYGGEDIDLATRVRRSGRKIHWIEDPHVRMYHIWHEPTINTVNQTRSGKEAVSHNRKILAEDPTWKRNVGLEDSDQFSIGWDYPSFDVISSPIDAGFIPTSSYLLLHEPSVVLRDDCADIMAGHLNGNCPAVAASSIRVDPTNVGNELPNTVQTTSIVLVIDSRLFPLVEEFLCPETWSLDFALAELLKARVQIHHLALPVGIEDNPKDYMEAPTHLASKFVPRVADLFSSSFSEENIAQLISRLPKEMLQRATVGQDLLFSFETSNWMELKELVEDNSQSWCALCDSNSGSAEVMALFYGEVASRVSNLKDEPTVRNFSAKPVGSVQKLRNGFYSGTPFTGDQRLHAYLDDLASDGVLSIWWKEHSSNETSGFRDNFQEAKLELGKNAIDNVIRFESPESIRILAIKLTPIDDESFGVTKDNFSVGWNFTLYSRVPSLAVTTALVKAK